MCGYGTSHIIYKHILYKHSYIHTCAHLRDIFEEEKEIGEVESGLAIIQDVSECIKEH